MYFMVDLGGYWYIVACSSEIKDKPVAKTRFGQRLVFWRNDQGKVLCFDDKCPHRSARLSKGQVNNNTITCPYHGIKFGEDGDCTHIPCDDINIPAGLKVEKYSVNEADGWIWFWRGPELKALLLEQLPPMPRYDLLDQECNHYGEASIPWPVHYTRAIEAQIDFSHVKTVHKTTLSLFFQGPPYNKHLKVEQSASGFKAYDQREVDRSGQYIHFCYPNLWVNRIAKRRYCVQAIVPVDNDHTEIYSRSYSFCRFPRFPIGSWLSSRLGAWFNRLVAKQDLNVVVDQLPCNSDHVNTNQLDTEYDNNEILLPSDAPIIAYRKMRKRYAAYLSAVSSSKAIPENKKNKNTALLAE
jgi:phenylpropionate dioxygenase-like ring-hydroxylating dioxygenase large terminal subunit